MKTISKVLLWFGGVVLVAVLALVIFFVSMMSRLKVTPTGQVSHGLWAIADGYVNLFVIKNGDRYLCIDAGSSAENVARGMGSLNLDPGKVSHVFFTHCDGDHAGGFRAFPNAKYIIPEAEVPMVTGQAARRIWVFSMKRKTTMPYTTIADREIRSVGSLTVQSILTPGHTSGHSCLLVNGKWLFTGDLMYIRDGTAFLLPEFIHNDAALAKRSMRLIASLTNNIELLATAHGGVSRDFTKAMAAWR